MLQNLRRRAVVGSYGDDNNTVTISTTVRHNQDDKKDNGNTDEVVISIKDRGTGIDPDIQPRLFSKFATKSDSGGSGLGLFISKSIVEAHGGKIWAENNKDGKGSTFYFSIPLNR